MFPIPQLPLDLRYGKVVRVGTADFLIADSLSHYRMAVFQDKVYQNEKLDSTPQLIAQVIAARQANGEDQGDDDLFFGVRVNGYSFHFYVIPVTKSILHAMKTSTRALDHTAIYKLLEHGGLDFRRETDREVIIDVLGYMCQYLKKKGIESPRR
jgi:hypothetical protein